MEINNRPIGVFDSGMGGLTAVSEIMKIMPHEDIVYLGDTARVPYGTKGREIVLEYAAQDLGFLRTQGVKYVIAACGTVSSAIVGEKDFGGEMFTGVIAPAAEAALRTTKNKKIGVIATGASIKIGAYEKVIKEVMPEAEVISKACPMFVPLVENGYVSRECEPAKGFAREYLEPVKAAGADTLILGCTHYPLLSGIISDILGEGVALISSGAEAVRFCKRELGKKGLMNHKNTPGKVEMFCTDSEELFRENVSRFLNIEGAEIKRVRFDE